MAALLTAAIGADTHDRLLLTARWSVARLAAGAGTLFVPSLAILAAGAGRPVAGWTALADSVVLYTFGEIIVPTVGMKMIKGDAERSHTGRPGTSPSLTSPPTP